MDRRAWTREEDNAIQELVNKYGIKKWTTISEKMEKTYNLSPRSGKQCRERWYNHLDPTINKKEWSQEEELIIFQAHRKYGNKWADISKYLVGRTDNSVKNHFYSTLRKSLRRINKYLGDKNSTVQVKEIKPGVLSKLFSLIEQNYSDSDENYKKLIQHSDNLKDCLFNFAHLKPQKSKTSQQHENLKMIIGKINEFNKLYKRQKKSKLIKKSNQNKKSFAFNMKNKDNKYKQIQKIEHSQQMFQKEILRDVEYKYFQNEKFLQNCIQKNKHIFLISDKQNLNSNIINIQKLYMTKTNQYANKNQSDFNNQALQTDNYNLEQKPSKQVKTSQKYDFQKFNYKLNMMKNENQENSLDINTKQDIDENYNGQNTPIQNNNMLQSILYCNQYQENAEENTLQQNGIANSPFQSVQFTKNINIVPMTPKIEFGENWSKINTDLQKNFEQMNYQYSKYQSQDNIEFKQQKNDKFDLMVNELKNNIDKKQDRRPQEEQYFIKSPQSSFQFFLKKD